MTRRTVGLAIRDVVGITVGCVIYALSFALFVIPRNLAPGGISGLAIVINHFFGQVPIGATIIILNAPLFLISFKRLGRGFLWRSIYATVISSVLIDVMVRYTNGFEVDMLLSSVYAGVIMGVGIGVIFRFFGSTGGTDLLAQLLSEHIGLTFGTTLLVIDTVIIVLSGVAFKSVTIPLYSILSLYISSKTIDLVQEGMSFSKAAWVVSSQPEEIAARIMSELDRGVTKFTAVGAYTSEPKEVVFCVVPQSQISHLKQIVHDVDPNAFVAIMEVTETLGQGFKELGTR
ncbi:MAG TPA: YitT family protein [Candidatus Cryosericum sp.]|nr:YitT family protein [Candidatus Cryosericum sp.]